MSGQTARALFTKVAGPPGFRFKLACALAFNASVVLLDGSHIWMKREAAPKGWPFQGRC